MNKLREGFGGFKIGAANGLGQVGSGSSQAELDPIRTQSLRRKPCSNFRFLLRFPLRNAAALAVQ